MSPETQKITADFIKWEVIESSIRIRYASPEYAEYIKEMKIIEKVTNKFERIYFRIEPVLAKILGKQIVHMLHIGKTGGTAIKYALENHKSSKDYLLILHSHDTNLTNIPKGEKVFFFLRDPITRFISGFYSRKRKGRPRNNIQWTEGENAAFKKFNTPNELALDLFSKSKQKKDEAQKAMKDIYHVNSFLLDWFKDEEYFLSRLNDILFIGFQENLENDFKRLKSILNLNEKVILPRDKVKSHKNPVYFDKHLDPQSKKNLRQWYEKDYNFMNLCANLGVDPIIKNNHTIKGKNI